ncbi:MAG: OadG family protein [Bacteroidota bacterium]|nr:OadG family protein [Bacteroidota bacterium]
MMTRKFSFIPLMSILITGGGQNESSGPGVAITSMIIVFLVLVALYFIYRLLTVLYSIDIRQQIIRRKGKEKVASVSPEAIPGEVNAAIVMALYLYQHELHDNENTVLTIKKVSRTYSPWSSKIYGLRQNPR